MLHAMNFRCLVGFSLAAATVLAGCRGTSEPAGSSRDQEATYRRRTLSTDLPPQVRVPSVAAAAEMALRHRGYAVTRSPTTEDYARIEGEAPNPGWCEKVVIRARQTPSRTRIEIIAEPLGDQTLSRAVLDEMLVALGR
jgi:hypothetical protein